MSFPGSPTSVSGLAFWYDAADPAGTGTAPASGTRITTWVDKSGNGRNATTAGTGPTYTTNIFNDRYPALVFSFNPLVTSAFTWATTTNRMSFFVVCRCTQSYRDFISSDDNTAFSLYFTTDFNVIVGNSYYTAVALGLQKNILQSYISNSSRVMSYTYGTLTRDNNINSTPSLATNRTLTIGKNNFIGTICEIIGYNTDISTTNRQLIEGYLANKWGLRKVLIATHPYSIYNYLPTGSRPSIPQSISGLQFWVDTSNPLTSGNGLPDLAIVDNVSMIAGTPSITTNSPTGKKTFTYSGSQAIDTTYSLDRTTHCIAVVHRPATAAGVTHLANSTDVIFPYWNGTSAVYVNAGNASLGTGTSTLAVPTSTSEFNITIANVQSGNQDIYNNGILTGSTTFSLSAGSSSFSIGSDSTRAAYYNGSICEVLVYNAYLTTDQIATLHRYLYLKWINATITPRAILGCRLWVDPSDPTTTATALTDKSANATTLTVTGTFGLNPSAPTGRQTLRTTGTQSVTTNLTVDFTKHCIIGVQKPVSVTTNTYRRLFVSQPTPGTTPYIIFPHFQSVNEGYINSQNANLQTGNSDLLTDNASITTFNVIIANIKDGAQEVYNNNQLQRSKSETSLTANSQTLELFKSEYQGDVGELLWYDRYLSRQELLDLWNYLQPRWLGNSVFNPSMVPGLQLWIDAADGSTKPNVIIDRSGNNNVSTLTAQFGLVPSVTPTNQRVLRFSGTQAIQTPIQLDLRQHCFVAVHKPINTSQSSLFRAQASNATYVSIPYYASGVPRGYINSQNANTLFNNSQMLENSATDSFNLLVANISSSSQAILNNFAPQSLSTFTFTAATNSLAIGYRQANSDAFYNGDVAELLVWNRNLTGSELSGVQNYLTKKWISPTTFDPTSISGLVLWLDPSDPTTGVSTFTDKSLSGTSLINFSTQFTILSNASPTGQTMLRFSGQQAISTNITITTQTHCFMGIHRPKSRITNNRLFVAQTSAYAVFPYYYNSGPGYNKGYINSRNADLVFNISNELMNENSSLSQLNLICANISSNQQDIYTNSQNIIQTKYTLSGSNNASLHIGGGREPVPSEFYQGDIGDLFVFNRALTNTELANMTNYLTNKWLGYLPKRTEQVVQFTTTGSTTWTAPAGVTSVTYLVVGGGGGGGGAYNNGAAGGGGGGLALFGTLNVVPGTSYTVVVGAGGAGGTGTANVGDTIGTEGNSSSFHTITASGGSGGQGSSNTNTGGARGNAITLTAPGGGGGGGRSGNSNGGGGGGGMGSAGTTATSGSGGAGGSGITYTISGSSTTYSVGGAGATKSNTDVTGSNGTANRGNGGGGASANSPSGVSGGNGGSGVVILAFEV